MSSRRRAVVEFPIECSLFINEKALYSITGMTQFYIKSASATMVKRSQVSNGCNRLSILFYDNWGTDVCASTIKIPDVWTPKLFLGLLLQERCLTKNVISLFWVKDQAYDDIFKMRLLYYHRDATELQELIKSSPNYSFVTGGFYLVIILIANPSSQNYSMILASLSTEDVLAIARQVLWTCRILDLCTN